MNNKLNPRHSAVKMAIALVLIVGVVGFVSAETIKKIHSQPQLVINSGTGGLNDVTDATTGLSTTVDLAGGDLDKLSFGVFFGSGTGIGTGSIKLQVSPDGGSNWFETGYTQNFTTAGAVVGGATTYANIPTQPGTKARFVTTLNGSTTFYNFKVYAMPSAD